MRFAVNHCPDCEGFEKVYAHVAVCRTCGLGRTTSRLTPYDQQNYLTDASPTAWLAERREYFERLHRKYLRRLPRGKSVDIGCGRGQFVEVLLEAGWDAYGLDSYCDAREGGRFIRGSVDSLVAGSAYDLITMVHTLEHVTNPRQSLAKVLGALRPGGTFLVVVPNFSGQWSVECGERWPMLDTQNHAFHYTVAALRSLLVRADFVLQRADTYSGYAASAWQRRLGANGFYERGLGSRQPFRSIVFRINAAARPLLNAYIDLTKRGAEIIALASKSSG